MNDPTGMLFMNGRILAGKTALISGGSSGIGLASAKALAQDGAAVVIMGRSVAGLADARDEIVAAAPDSRVEVFAGDAVDEEAVKRALTFAHDLFRGLDMVISVVGNPTFKPLLMREL